MKAKQDAEKAGKKTGKKNEKKGVPINLGLRDLINLFSNAVIKRKGLIKALDLEIDKKIDEFVQKGEITPKEGKKAAKKAKEEVHKLFEKVGNSIDARIQKVLETLHIASINDIRKIEAKLDAILSKVDILIDEAKESPVESAPKEKRKVKKATGKTSGKTSKATGKKK